MYELKRYDASLSKDWDYVVEHSKNGNFIHLTQYFRYHETRFNDVSVLIYKKNRVWLRFFQQILLIRRFSVTLA